MRIGSDDDLSPADASSVVRVAELEMLSGCDGRAAQDHLEPHCVQAACSRRKGKRVCNRNEHHRPSVKCYVYAAGETRGIHASVDTPLPRLERRDLCEIEHVAHE